MGAEVYVAEDDQVRSRLKADILESDRGPLT